MSKRVQFIGHDFEQANQFIGDPREITVDYTNWELRLHDGETPGGFKILNRDQNDDRYQARSTELDGFLGWEPSDRGLLVRLGPGNYKLRELTAPTGSFKITNPLGFNGNILVEFADEIDKDIKWVGDHEFTEPIKASGGVEGNVTGNLTGNSAGKHTGEVEGDVTGDLKGNTFGTHTGPVDLSGSGLAMDDGALALEWLSEEVIQFIVRAGLPVGSIIAYSGALEDIPTNWNICDGTNGTPDLRGRFIIGASGSYPIDSSGGSAGAETSLTISESGAHEHTGSATGTSLTVAQLPEHRHGNGVGDAGTSLWFYGSTPGPQNTSDSIDNNGNSGTNQGWTSTVGAGEAHGHGIDIDLGGAHTHEGKVTVPLPPYYALIYIRKGA